jgi:hypothetical protein
MAKKRAPVFKRAAVNPDSLFGGSTAVPDPEAVERALTPIDPATLPFRDAEIEAGLAAENKARSDEMARIEKSMKDLPLDEFAEYTKSMLRGLANGNKWKRDPKLEQSMRDAMGVLDADTLASRQSAQKNLSRKSAEGLDKWTKSGAPTGQDIKPLKRISLKPKKS